MDHGDHDREDHVREKSLDQEVVVAVLGTQVVALVHAVVVVVEVDASSFRLEVQKMQRIRPCRLSQSYLCRR